MVKFKNLKLMNTFNILTLNTWGKYGPYELRWNIFLWELTTIKADVLLLEEVVDEELIQLLIQKINFTHYAFFPAPQLAILSRFPIHTHESILFPTQSKLETSARGVLICKIKIGQTWYQIANTHLSWKTEDESTREHQVQDLLNILHSYSGAQIVGGDLNDVSTSPSIQLMLKSGFIDLFELLHPKEAGVTWDNVNPFIQGHSIKFQDRRIDYLFANSSFLNERKILTCDVVFNQIKISEVYASDHYGVFCQSVIPSAP